ncbi:DUF5617 domain-containing protein [Legionella cardiaca]|uniref:DUF5617 domain-containing protein n=1 Tax=Legionella cardiaca TaxID=1071983 RepID=A0ABY8AWH8_9GAMM|nr:DUF5617 domain-containing protein [Legionella cardiaca]WED43492.1 DUF5617 domain-containing protein [Legionella cardiaca]
MLLPNIDIKDYKKVIAEKISLIIDPISQEIPLDPLFVNYFDSQFVRIYSKASVLELQKQNALARQLLEEIKLDKTGVCVALKSASNLSESEKSYKDFLLTMKDLTSEKILAILQELQKIAQIVKFSLPAQSLLLKIHRILHKDIEVYVEAFLRLAAQSDGEKAIKGLFKFYEAMFRKQTEITAERHGQLMINGNPLSNNQVICPIFRKRINVADSLKNTTQASYFLAIFIALSKLAEVEDSDIELFLKNQSPEYLSKANTILLRYLRYPILFNFTPQQKNFLIQIGAQAAATQIRYPHLWDEEKSLEENALSLLRDYTKQDWSSPLLGLFICGHWNRHHLEKVRETIRELQGGGKVRELLEELKYYAKSHSQYNPQGSLACRLEFIQYKIDKIAALKPFPEVELEDALITLANI